MMGEMPEYNTESDGESLLDDELDVASTTQSSKDASQSEESRDEVKEIQKISRSHTNRIRFWRLVVIFFLTATAVAVTVTTYIFLSNEQENNFEEAFDQFSNTLEESVLRQQLDIRTALSSFSHLLSSAAETEGAQWPNFTLPQFEYHAEDFLTQARSEFLAVSNYVRGDERREYEAYAKANYKDWMKEGHFIKHGNLDKLDQAAYHPFITRAGSDPGTFDPEDELEHYLPSWTYSPPPVTYGATNINQRGDLFDALLNLKNETLVAAVSEFKLGDIIFSIAEHEAFHSSIEGSSGSFPHGRYYHPVNRHIGNHSEVVAILETVVGFDVVMRNLLPDSVHGVVVVLENTCNQTYTYQVDGAACYYLGDQDLHDHSYTSYEQLLDLSFFSNDRAINEPGHCIYTMRIYPSDEFKEPYDDATPEIFAIVVAGAFLVVIFVFIFYDVSVQRRNQMIVSNAARSNAIVSSLFPAHIRDRLLEQEQQKNAAAEATAASSKMRSFLRTNDSKQVGKARPLAELFLETTLLFADIAGFTAWSSTREPTQVFDLLECVYSELDKLSKKHKVLKVETVGDSYVAVTGLPDPMHDHAIVMAKFARDCLHAFNMVVRNLEVKLGPDTGDLQLRIGMHSGPVTAGVLRGDRARFQLFGDTVNTAARLESTGVPDRIQVSQESAGYIIDGGKGHWLKARDDMVEAKGKGLLKTYWLVNETRRFHKRRNGHGSESGESETEHSSRGAVDMAIPDKQQRLRDWIAEALLRYLQQIVALRMAKRQANGKRQSKKVNTLNTSTYRKKSFAASGFPIDEVQEIIHLPAFDVDLAKLQEDPSLIQIDQEVLDELKELVGCLATMYNNNPFHSFAHASHVVMSVAKLMSRIVAPTESTEATEEYQQTGSHAACMHDHTYGITSDPLTQFACAFSALIHDVDHLGVPNATLVNEDLEVARHYQMRSVAEQNSLDLSWSLLMEDRFSNLRATLFDNQDDADRFRALVVNSVMATDIADKDLKVLRNNKWEKAFAEVEDGTEQDPRDVINRKATIVIEHLIQASDVSHTMQHWKVYRKWNECLYAEMYAAYKAGRSDKDPTDFWYKGELGFFDFYIIPLAKKLKECGVFGVSSDEYLIYAQNNRAEWEMKGEHIVEELKKKYGHPDAATN
eukprot:Nitzschia sp. Nitz4//scaffold270_size25879//13071//16782//NITZ4_008299-RA/size25879-augustus-gene-0.20-mRNA-1//-1//CDS//3329545193//9431//frame0